MNKLTNETFDEAINRSKMSIVDFSAVWCIHCRTLGPILERVSKEMPEYDFYTVDVDECEEIAKRYRVFSIPMIACFKNGKLINTQIGVHPTDDMIDFFKECDKQE